MRLLIVALLALLLLPATALADQQYQWGETEAPVLNPAMRNVPEPALGEGPCTTLTRAAMPASPEHGDHLDIHKHDFSCRMPKVFFDPLTEVLKDRPDMVLGEMDVKGNLMVIATAYPESGFLLYDISNPASPKLLSHYRGEECENVVNDTDCGAYVDLSPDLKRVYISVQQIYGATTFNPSSRPLAAYPGVEVVDISMPTLPVLIQTQPVTSIGGTHTTRSFTVPESGGEGPREPGEYIVSVANSVGSRDPPGAPVRLARPAAADAGRRDARHLHPGGPDPQAHAALRGGRVHDGLLRLGHHGADRAGPAGRVGPDARVRQRLVRPHDRRHRAQRQAHRDDAQRADRLLRRAGRRPRELRLAVRASATTPARCGSSTPPTSPSSGRRRTDDEDRRRRTRALKAALREDADHLLVQPGAPRRRRAHVLAAQPADRRRQGLPVAVPRRRRRARRQGGVRGQERAARRSWRSTCRTTGRRGRSCRTRAPSSSPASSTTGR